MKRDIFIVNILLIMTSFVNGQAPVTFKAIEWANGPFYLRVQLDGMLMGTSELLSVPYALYAKKSEVFLPPRMTYEEIFAISEAADGMLIFCTDCEDSSGALITSRFGEWYILSTNCLGPMNPTAGIHDTLQTQITWNWNAVPEAIGYKWNITDDYNNAIDLGSSTSKIDSGLYCNTPYIRYVWAYTNLCHSVATILTQTTAHCTFITCLGPPITISHIVGDVAPVTKIVAYNTATNIPGEPSKCWITSNLGADHQAIAVYDDTEASAGWYWQFNRMRGYMHDGSTVIPSWTITNIDENSEWIISNDPCSIEFGNGWRIPSRTEWYNVDISGGWEDWNDPWNSDLRLHAAGSIERTNGVLYNRGNIGYYWSSSQENNIKSWHLYLNMGSCLIYNWYKAYGFSVRCIHD